MDKWCNDTQWIEERLKQLLSLQEGGRQLEAELSKLNKTETRLQAMKLKLMGTINVKFLCSFQVKWREEPGNAWNVNNTTQSLFKVMVKKPCHRNAETPGKCAKTQELQNALDVIE